MCVALMILNPSMCHFFVVTIRLIWYQETFIWMVIYVSPQQLLQRYILWDQPLYFPHLSLLLHFLLCRPWWVSLVSIKTWDIGKKRVVSPFFLVLTTLSKRHNLSAVQSSHLCAFIFQCIKTWINVLNIHLTPSMIPHGWFYNSYCFLFLCITWRKI